MSTGGIESEEDAYCIIVDGGISTSSVIVDEKCSSEEEEQRLIDEVDNDDRSDNVDNEDDGDTTLEEENSETEKHNTNVTPSTKDNNNTLRSSFYTLKNQNYYHEHDQLIIEKSLTPRPLAAAGFDYDLSSTSESESDSLSFCYSSDVESSEPETVEFDISSMSDICDLEHYKGDDEEGEGEDAISEIIDEEAGYFSISSLEDSSVYHCNKDAYRICVCSSEESIPQMLGIMSVSILSQNYVLD